MSYSLADVDRALNLIETCDRLSGYVFIHPDDTEIFRGNAELFDSPRKQEGGTLLGYYKGCDLLATDSPDICPGEFDVMPREGSFLSILLFCRDRMGLSDDEISRQAISESTTAFKNPRGLRWETLKERLASYPVKAQSTL